MSSPDPFVTWMNALREPEIDLAATALREGKQVVVYGPRGFGKERVILEAARRAGLAVKWIHLARLAGLEPSEAREYLCRALCVLPGPEPPGLQPDLQDYVAHAPAGVVVLDGIGSREAAGPVGAGALQLLMNSDGCQAIAAACPYTRAVSGVPGFEPVYYYSKYHVSDLGSLRGPGRSAVDGLEAAMGCSPSTAEAAIDFTGGHPRWTWLALAALRNTGKRWTPAFEANLARAPNSPVQPWWEGTDVPLSTRLGEASAARAGLEANTMLADTPAAVAAELVSMWLFDAHRVAVPGARMRYLS